MFAKKSKSSNIGDDLYTSVVSSYTYNTDYTITVSKKFLNLNEHILIIDDFLASGNALKGLIDVANQAGCTIEGLGIVIEKGFQSGGNYIRNLGYDLQSLAIIDNMDNNIITFKS